MPITLKITSYQRHTPNQEASFTSDMNRFSVGRKSGNHWTLPDPQRFMSGTHCWFENRNGSWFVTDTSTNGVFVNKSDQRMAKNDSVEVRSGDSVRIGDYDLEIDIAQDAGGYADTTGVAPDLAADPFGGGDGGLDIDDIIGTPEGGSPAQPLQREERPHFKDVNTPLSQMDDSLLGDPVDIDDLYDLDEDEPEEHVATLADTGGRGPAHRQNYSAPETHTTSSDDRYGLDLSDIPENWDDDSEIVDAPAQEPPTAAEKKSEFTPQPEPPRAEPAHSEPPRVVPQQTEPPEPARAEPPVVEPARPRPDPAPVTASAATAGSHVEAFAAGAGLDTAQLRVGDESVFFQELGGLFMVMTEGLMQVIASRTQIKSEFRLEQTMIAPTDNNPFKFSASAHEAMTRLFNQGDKAYLSGLAATEEAVDDISAHQMAVLAGTEAALRDILRRFDPKTLEDRFSKDSLLGKAMPALEKARCWDFFKVLYEEVSDAADDDFQQLFGSEFSKAYEDQLDRLKLARRESSK